MDVRIGGLNVVKNENKIHSPNCFAIRRNFFIIYLPRNADELREINVGIERLVPDR